MTAQEAYDLLMAYTGDDEFDEDSLFYSWITAINSEAYKIMYKLNPVSFLTTKTFTTTVGVSEYAFADIDLEDFHSLRTSGCGVFVVESGIITKKLPMSEYGASGEGYWIGNANINILPIPTVATTYTIRYIPIVENITSLADNLVIPDEFGDLVVEELKIRYDKRDEEFELMQVSDTFAKRYKDRLLEDEKYSPSNDQGLNIDFMFRQRFSRL